MWVVVFVHVDFEFWDNVSELDTVYIDVHGDVSADIMHGTDINVSFTENEIFPDVEVLVDNGLFVLLPSEPKGIEISIAGSVFRLDVIPPTPDIVVVPLK